MNQEIRGTPARSILLAGSRERSRSLKMRYEGNGILQDDAEMVEDLLELGGGLRGLAGGQERETPDIS